MSRYDAWRVERRILTESAASTTNEVCACDLESPSTIEDDVAQRRVTCNGDLDRVLRVIRLDGFAVSTPYFIQQPQVVNSASELMKLSLVVEISGDAGR